MSLTSLHSSYIFFSRKPFFNSYTWMCKYTQTFLSLPMEKLLSLLSVTLPLLSMPSLKHRIYYIIMWYGELWNWTVLGLNPNLLVEWTLDFFFKWILKAPCENYMRKGIQNEQSEYSVFSTHGCYRVYLLSPQLNKSSSRERALSYISLVSFTCRRVSGILNE